MNSSSPDSSWNDRLKNLRRNLRYHLVRGLIDVIGRRPLSSLPRFKRLFLKALPWFYQKEMHMAAANLPGEFVARSEEILAGMQENQVLNLLETLFYEKIRAEYPGYFHVEGREHLDAGVQAGRGVIILSAHFGSWELIGYYLAQEGLPLHVIVRPQAISRMTEFMNGFRQKRGVKVLMENNLSASLRLLRAGKVVGLVSDLNARERGFQAEFFGRNASFYPTPVLLGMRTGAAVIPTFIERHSPRRQNIRFEEPMVWEAEATMRENVQKYVNRFEQAFRRRPDHWVWFHDRYSHADLGRSD